MVVTSGLPCRAIHLVRQWELKSTERVNEDRADDMPLPPAVGDLARLRLRVAVLTLGSLRRRQRRRMRWRWRWAVNLTCKLRKRAGTAMMIVTIVVIGGIGIVIKPAR